MACVEPLGPAHRDRTCPCAHPGARAPRWRCRRVQCPQGRGGRGLVAGERAAPGAPAYLKRRERPDVEVVEGQRQGQGQGRERERREWQRKEAEELLACLKYALGMEGGGGVHEGEGPPPQGMVKEVFVDLCELLDWANECVVGGAVFKWGGITRLSGWWAPHAQKQMKQDMALPLSLPTFVFFPSPHHSFHASTILHVRNQETEAPLGRRRGQHHLKALRCARGQPTHAELHPQAELGVFVCALKTSIDCTQGRRGQDVYALGKGRPIRGHSLDGEAAHVAALVPADGVVVGGSESADEAPDRPD